MNNNHYRSYENKQLIIVDSLDLCLFERTTVGLTVELTTNVFGYYNFYNN